MPTPRILRTDGLMSYHERNLNVLVGADPIARVAFDLLLFRWMRMGEDVLVAECFRNREDQEREVKEGNSNAHWPYSFHNHGLAIDVVPVLFGQTAITYNEAARYKALAAEAKNVPGVEWLFELAGFDKPHFQLSQGRSITYYTKGGRPDFAPILNAARAYYEPLIERLRLAIDNKAMSIRRRTAMRALLILALENFTRVLQLTPAVPAKPV